MKKIIVTGGAGLVGHNLVGELANLEEVEIVVIDRNKANLANLKRLHPRIIDVLSDLAEQESWTNHFSQADVVVMLQAQIGGTSEEEFVNNNVVATRNILDCVTEYGINRLIHVSSSVVESIANDLYTKTKKEQESLVENSGINHVILRPTLMFGWFDRKHLGWLSRFMKKTPIFPIPGNGRYMRQPLYAGDFSRIIVSCINNPSIVGTYNISGQEEIEYIDIIRSIRRATKSKTLLVKIPTVLFGFLLSLWALFDKNPPFTSDQLTALIANDQFEVTDWQSIFSVIATPFSKAVEITFNDPSYSQIALEF